MSVVLPPVTDQFSSRQAEYPKRSPLAVGYSWSGRILAACNQHAKYAFGQHAKKAADLIATGLVATVSIAIVVWIIGESILPLQSAVLEIEAMQPRHLLHVLTGM